MEPSKPPKYEVVKPKPIEYKFIAIKYGARAFAKVKGDQPMELTNLNDQIAGKWENSFSKHLKAGWRIKQFFIHQKDIFVVLLEK
jgi:hypothetical protein